MEARIKNVDEYPQQWLEELLVTGDSMCYAYQQDPRFCYFLYVSHSYPRKERFTPLVLVHGSGRDASTLRDDYAAFAEQNDLIIISPLFPCGILDPNDHDSYKLVVAQSVHYDKILLGMLEECKLRYPKLDINRFLLYGFSGGGQFVHRFAYRYATRLCGLCIGAPGLIEPITDQTFKTNDLQLAALQSVPILMIVGERDLDTRYLVARGRQYDQNRNELMHLLKKNFESYGIKNITLVKVPGAGHDSRLMTPDVQKFFQLMLDS
jgi:pimeloyl-ACP methyl ester carboxylesterase